MPIRTHQAADGTSYTREGLDGAVRAMNAAEDRNGREEHRSHRHAAKDADAVSSPARSHPDEKRSRQEHSGRSHHRAKFGDFVLTRTLGEGEFGKVKAGWKPGSSVEVS